MKNEILKEQNFPSINMSYEERDLILELIVNCKDIRDSELGNTKKGELVQLTMRRENNIVKIDGMLHYKEENRTLEGYVFYDNDNVIFDMHIIRLLVNDLKKEYSTLDVFTPLDLGYKVTSSYNFDSKQYIEYINKKGKVR